MKHSVVIFAVVALGLVVVDAQVPDDKPAVNETQDRLSAPGSPAGVDVEDSTKKERRPGDRYFWDHDIGSGDRVLERAFAPNDSNVIVVKSRDRTLSSWNITRSVSVYYFKDQNSLVAIIPWRVFSPCLIRNTTLTYQGAIDLLTARNGSTTKTTSKVSIDANVAPLSPEESTAFVESNPGLIRYCSYRPIIITAELGDNPVPFSNSTNEITTLTLEADVSIIVPEYPDVPDSFKKPEGTDGFRRSEDQGFRWGIGRDHVLRQRSDQAKTSA